MGGSTKLKTRQRLIDMRGSGPTRVCPNAKSATRQSRKQTNAHDDTNATWTDGVRQDYSQNKMYNKFKKTSRKSPQTTQNDLQPENRRMYQSRYLQPLFWAGRNTTWVLIFQRVYPCLVWSRIPMTHYDAPCFSQHTNSMRSAAKT